MCYTCFFQSLSPFNSCDQGRFLLQFIHHLLFPVIFSTVLAVHTRWEPLRQQSSFLYFSPLYPAHVPELLDIPRAQVNDQVIPTQEWR